MASDFSAVFINFLFCSYVHTFICSVMYPHSTKHNRTSVLQALYLSAQKSCPCHCSREATTKIRRPVHLSTSKLVHPNIHRPNSR
jgi:hypothetical protein